MIAGGQVKIQQRELYCEGIDTEVQIVGQTANRWCETWSYVGIQTKTNRTEIEETDWANKLQLVSIQIDAGS